MITLDFSVAVAGCITVFMAVPLFLWLFDRKQKPKEQFWDPKCIWFCSVCTYTYVNTKQSSLSVCPRCGSYNKKILT